jgi:hypothetical protein
MRARTFLVTVLGRAAWCVACAWDGDRRACSEAKRQRKGDIRGLQLAASAGPREAMSRHADRSRRNCNGFIRPVQLERSTSANSRSRFFVPSEPTRAFRVTAEWRWRTPCERRTQTCLQGVCDVVACGGLWLCGLFCRLAPQQDRRAANLLSRTADAQPEPSIRQLGRSQAARSRLPACAESDCFGPSASIRARGRCPAGSPVH